MPREKQMQHQMALDRMRGTPLVTEMLEYLTARGAVPKFTTGESGGSFTYGDGYPKEGVISYAPWSQESIPHELVHAVQRQALQQGATRYSKAEQDSAKLVGGYSSADRKVFGGAKDVAIALNPEWAAAESDYRATPKELSAWAVGNAARGRRTDAVPHLDPTMLTELSILLDVMTRDLTGKNK